MILYDGKENGNLFRSRSGSAEVETGCWWATRGSLGGRGMNALPSPLAPGELADDKILLRVRRVDRIPPGPPEPGTQRKAGPDVPPETYPLLAGPGPGSVNLLDSDRADRSGNARGANTASAASCGNTA